MNHWRVVLEHLGTYRSAFSIFRSIWKLQERFVQLFGIAELFSYDFKAVVPFAGVIPVVVSVFLHVISEMDLGCVFYQCAAQKQDWFSC